MMSKIFSYFSALISLVISSLALAEPKQGSLTNTFDNMESVVVNVNSIVKAIIITAGIYFLAYSLLQFQKYRRNPVVAPISSVIFYAILGLCLIALTFIPFSE